jgi:phage tail protein X
MASRDYRCRPGETWDSIAFREYGNSFKASELLAANLKKTNVVVFEGGEVIAIPEIVSASDTAGLPPWRQ